MRLPALHGPASTDGCTSCNGRGLLEGRLGPSAPPLVWACEYCGGSGQVERSRPAWRRLALACRRRRTTDRQPLHLEAARLGALLFSRDLPVSFEDEVERFRDLPGRTAAECLLLSFVARKALAERHVTEAVALARRAAAHPTLTSHAGHPLWRTNIIFPLLADEQYDLAEQWTQAMERWRHGQPVGSIHGRCRLHRAEILRLRGMGGDAEREALAACDELRPYLRREFGWPLTKLGRIRLQRGDLAGALTAYEEIWSTAHAFGSRESLASHTSYDHAPSALGRETRTRKSGRPSHGSSKSVP